MCGTLPFFHWCRKRPRSSPAARDVSRWARPMVMNPASQLHWCGYRVGAALVQPPMSLRRSTSAASWKSPEEIAASIKLSMLPEEAPGVLGHGGAPAGGVSSGHDPVRIPRPEPDVAGDDEP